MAALPVAGAQQAWRAWRWPMALSAQPWIKLAAAAAACRKAQSTKLDGNGNIGQHGIGGRRNVGSEDGVSADQAGRRRRIVA